MATFQLSFDATDPPALARFWATALGYVEQPPPPGFDSWDAFADSAGVPPERRGDYAALVDPAGTGPRVFFQRVPERKAAKNRVHVDVPASGPDHDWTAVLSHVDRLVEAGGSVVAERDGPFGERWVVMQDPEGNELCVQ